MSVVHGAPERPTLTFTSFKERVASLVSLMLMLMAIFIMGFAVLSRSGPMDPWLHKDVGMQLDKRLSDVEEIQLKVENRVATLEGHVAEMALKVDSTDQRSVENERMLIKESQQLVQTQKNLANQLESVKATLHGMKR